MRTCNKACIANVCGECAVEKCEGQVQWLRRYQNAEKAAWAYKIAVDSFRDYFGRREANMDKPLKDWTLGECQEECENAEECCKCLLHSSSELSSCKIRIALYKKPDPAHWELIDKPRFTEQEVEDAKILARALLADGFERDKMGDVFSTSKTASRTLLDSRMFPSIQPGQSYTLDEIIGGAE